MPEIILPPLYRVTQPLVTEEIEEVGKAVAEALSSAGMAERVRPGMRIAVTAGSRGIDRIPEVLRATVEWLTRRGAAPFLLAAMGSHGGGTEAGRRAVLGELGITEEAVGAPIFAEGETVVLGEALGLPVYGSGRAARAEGVVIVNRVKPHTSYTGRHESGLAKMLAVGLGQAEGAAAFHAGGRGQLARLVPAMAELALAKLPILGGLALIENGRDRLHRIEGMAPEKILEREPELLELARSMKPRLPFAAADVLVVDYLGKDLSGTGMDTTVIGRLYITGEPEPETPRIKRIAALRLSPKSRGSAYGIGLADVTTAAVVRAMDPAVTLANALASTFLERARAPLSFPSDRSAIHAAVQTCGVLDPSALQLARIRDTQNLEQILVSGPLLKSLDPSVKSSELPLAWEFDDQGNLRDLAQK